MTVAYEAYEAKAIEAAIKLVAEGATFISLVGTGQALNRIVEIDGGDEDETTPVIRATSGSTFARTVALWAHVWPGDGTEMGRTWLATQTITNEGSIPVAFYWRPAGITYRHELLRYVLSKTGLIARDIENQQGATGKWRKIVASIPSLTFLDPTGHAKGVIRSVINIQYGDLP